MNFRLVKMRIQSKKALVSFWYWLLKPIAYFYTKDKVNARYEKKKAKITKEMAIQWLAEDIAKYVVQYSVRYKKKHEVSFLIADFVSDDLSGYDSLYHLNWSMLKRDKTRMAYHKFNRDVDFQQAIFDKLGSFKGIVVEEEIETFTWQRIRNYQKTVHVSYEG